MKKSTLLLLIISAALISHGCQTRHSVKKPVNNKTSSTSSLPFLIYRYYGSVDNFTSNKQQEAYPQSRGGSRTFINRNRLENVASRYLKKGYCVKVTGVGKGPYLLRGFKIGSGILKLIWFENTIVLKNSAENEGTTILRGHCLKLNQLVFSPNRKLLASGGQDSIVYLWNVKEKKKFTSFGHREYSRSQSNQVRQLRFSADSKRLAILYSDNSIAVLNTITGKLLYKISKYIYSKKHKDYRQSRAEKKAKKIINIYFSKGHRYLVIARANSIELHKASNAKYTKTIRHKQMQNIMSSAMLSQSDIAIVAAKNRVYIWNIARGKLIKYFTENRKIITQLTLDNSNKYLVTGGSDNILRVYNTENWREKIYIELEKEFVPGRPKQYSGIGRLQFDSHNNLHIRTYGIRSVAKTFELILHKVTIH